jgi:hypothetical protein
VAAGGSTRWSGSPRSRGHEELDAGGVAAALGGGGAAAALTAPASTSGRCCREEKQERRENGELKEGAGVDGSRGRGDGTRGAPPVGHRRHTAVA